jgi:hypothetical protein
MQVIARLKHHDAWRSAIWDKTTGKLVWAPEDTIALTWLSDGREVGLIREHYRYRPELHGIVGSAFQSEFTHTWERRAWPEETLLSSCPIKFPMGWPTGLVVSPRSDIAIVQWFDQGESGLEFIAITQKGDQQILKTGFPLLDDLSRGSIRPDGNGFPLPSNLATEPVFSPDGRFILIGWQDWWEWWNEEHEDEIPASGGLYHIGALAVLGWDARTTRVIPLTEELPAGWLPPPATDERERLLRNLCFRDATHFQVTLPTGTTRTYTLIA